MNIFSTAVSALCQLFFFFPDLRKLHLKIFFPNILFSVIMWKHGNKSKAWNGPPTRWVAFLVFVLSVGNTDQKTSSLLGLPEEKWNSLESVVKFSPTLEFPNGTEVIGKYQIHLKHFFFWLMVAEVELYIFGINLLTAPTALVCQRNG